MHTQTETHKSPLARYLILILALTAALIAGTALGSGQQAFAAGSSSDSGAPTKTVTPNGDGTYTLKLSVTGQSSSTTVTTPTEAVLVMDISGSMNDYVTTVTTYTKLTTTPFWWRTYYGFVNGNYVELDYHRNKTWTYTDSNGNNQTYSGDFYTASTTGKTRLDVAKAAAKTTVEQLLDSGVTVKLVTFSTKASEAQTLTSSNYASVIDGLEANGGTNWEAGLTNAEAALTKDDKTNKNVIFMSDGNPTYRNSANGYNDDYNRRTGVYGTGNSDLDGYNYDAAQKVAYDIVKNKKAEFYSIGVFDNVSNMQNLAKDAYDDQSTEKNYYSASDSASLQAAFADIVQSIKNTISRTNFNVTDTLTRNTDSTVNQNATYKGNADNFKYEITDADGNTTVYNAATDGAKMVGEATVSGKTINWRPNTPPNGQTYSVSAIIWPNQDAVDKAAKEGAYTLETNVGTSDQATYDEVKTTTQSNPEDGIQDLIEKNGNYIYSYNYNGTDKQITLKPDGQGGYTDTDGSGATLQQKDGVWTLTVPNVTKFTSGEMAVSAASTTLKINKVWKNDAATSHDPITVKIVTKEDDQDKDYLTGTIGASGNWEADMAVAPGLKADVDGDGKADLLNAGHIYKLSEPSLDTAHYTVSYSDDQFTTGFTPMIVNENGKLKLVGLPNGSTSLTITNTRKEIKTGVKNTDNTAPMVGAGLALAALAAVFVFKRKLGR
jgi:uncharacterized protein YegL